MKRQILSIIIALACMAAGAARLDFKGRDAAMVGTLVIDLKTGKELASENPDKLMLPASILKILTSATALSVNNPHARFETEVEITGDIVGTTLYGDLIVKSSGDPTIESSYFEDQPSFIQSIVEALRLRGITEIKGEITVNMPGPTDFGPNPQWTVGDVGWRYGTSNYGFNYSDNSFTLDTYTLETVPDVPFADFIIEECSGNNDVVHGIYSDTYFISGRNVNKQRNTIALAMDSPAETFISNLKDALAAAGILVGEGPVESSDRVELLLTHRSPENLEILQSLMFRSDNMMAEAMLRSILPGESRDDCIKKEKEYWSDLGLNTEFQMIFDGSGLARSNRVTPRFLAGILSSMAKGDRADEFVSLFPKVGKEGTVKNFMKKTPLAGHLVLKSGSVNAVQCYAGYKLGRDGTPTHVIVVMVNSFACPRADVRKGIENFLRQTFN